MKIIIFKYFFIFLIVLVGTKISALTNDEVRTEIQSCSIDTQTFPQDIDADTVLIGIQVSTRGIVYNYKLKLPGDEISNFLQVFDNIKMGAINGLCELPALNWYKENQVEMIYTYMDENDNLVTIFKNSFLKVLITMQSNENV